MRGSPRCPRCGGELHEPSIWHSAWTCDIHGEVQPLQRPLPPSQEGLGMVVRAAAVPVWVPWPLPDDWLVTGFAYAGDERTGGVACAVALSGPAPLGGPADMLVISEEPGVGLGAAYAGLTAADPGEGFGSCAPPVKVYIHGHPSPLWSVPTGPDRAAFAGEAMASWLWLVLWPETASLALEVDQMHLRDLRDHDQQLDLPYGAMSPRLTEPA